MKTYHFYKWRIWIILALAFVMALFHRSALGAISTDVTDSLGLTASQLSQLAAITFYTYALMQIPAGILLDRFGYKKISLYGMLITGSGSMLFGVTSNLMLAYLSRFLIGLGSSVIFISILKAQQTWFSKEAFTKASGLLSFIGNIGGVVATFPLALLAAVMGWRESMFFMGMLCLIVAYCIGRYTANRPESYGFTSPHAQSEAPVTPTHSSLFGRIKTVLLSKHTWRNFFILFTLVGCTTTLTGLWGVRYLETIYGLSNTQASFYIAFIIYGLVAGSLCVDRIATLCKGKHYLYPRIGCVINACIWVYILLFWGGKPPLASLVVCFFIMGFVAMSHILAFTDITEKTPAYQSGLASSVVNSGEFIGSALIAFGIGVILDFTWQGTLQEGIRVYEASSYTLAFMLFLGVSLLGCFTSFLGNKQV